MVIVSAIQTPAMAATTLLASAARTEAGDDGERPLRRGGEHRGDELGLVAPGGQEGGDEGGEEGFHAGIDGDSY